MTVLDSLFRNAEVDGFLHAVDLGTGAEVEHGGGEPVVLASVFKIPVLLELFVQGAQGRLDLAAPHPVPAEGRSPGPYGISVMRDLLTMSLRDLAWLMMGISDNAATDVICDVVTIDRVNGRIAELGLRDTHLVGACRDLFASIGEDLGISDPGLLAKLDLTDAAVIDRLRVIDPRATSRSTPRDVTTLLTQIWDDTAGSPHVCGEVRRILGLQVWPHRLAAGFPEDGVTTSGKTGTLPRWRNEAGVVEYPDGGRYAVAVFTRSASTAQKNPAADAAIGAAARAAVDLLRS
ncbi:MAG: class A beta-lactamase-related serine hydrolase [Actinomycetota bacterium]|nr:class A beta-lactamase-related serine hydrolase [Actinomycetota bacterium]